MKIIALSTTLALVLGVTAAQADPRQLAASAGVDAAGLTTIEIVRIKHAAEARGDDRQPAYVTPDNAGAGARSQLIASARLSAAEAADMSLAEIAAAKARRESRGDDRQPIVVAGSGGASYADAQFAASAGVAPESARMMSMHEVYLAKIFRESGDN